MSDFTTQKQYGQLVEYAWGVIRKANSDLFEDHDIEFALEIINKQFETRVKPLFVENLNTDT